MSPQSRKLSSLCPTCGQSFELTQHLVADVWYPAESLCDACDKAKVDQAKGEAAMRDLPVWKRRWMDLTPAEFQRPIDRTRLIDQEHFDAAASWRPSEISMASLLLVGDTGLAKTRAAHQTLRSMLEARPQMSIEKFNCVSFGETARAKAYAGQGQQWFDRLGQVDLVFFDDLFRGVLTDQAQEELFGLISIRTENRLTTIATTQFSFKSLSTVLKPHHAEALARRFREFFTVVAFKRPSNQPY